MSEPPFLPQNDPRWYREKDLPPWGDPFPERTAAKERARQKHNDYLDVQASVETISLERLRAGQVVPISMRYLEDVTAELATSILRDALVDGMLRLQGFVLTETLAPESESKSVTFPKSPFQHWKKNHASSWWLRRFVRRWPVRTDRVTLTVECSRWRTFPESKIRFPNNQLGRPVQLTQMSNRLEWMNDA